MDREITRHWSHTHSNRCSATTAVLLATCGTSTKASCRAESTIQSALVCRDFEQEHLRLSAVAELKAHDTARNASYFALCSGLP